MRLFTALDPPPALRSTGSDLQDALSLPARWTDPSQFHITVRFIGEVDDLQGEAYEDALTTLSAAPARCIPYGLDVLPSRRSPRVVTLGFERTDSLLALYEAVSEVLGAEGLAPEDRPYRPHLTLARLDDPDPDVVHEALAAVDPPALESFQADALHLYESTPTPEGALHDRRASVPLDGRAHGVIS
ncbi:MAG: RNA 2',3'-cyclic phosphodiesterase [Salinivenus sp.]